MTQNYVKRSNKEGLYISFTQKPLGFYEIFFKKLSPKHLSLTCGNK